MSSAARFLVRPGLTLLTLVLTVSFAALPRPLRSADLRSGYRPVAYAIQGARIVAGPESTLESGTVVVRDGVIEAVGPADKVTIPYDAEVLDGKGLTVYPGFVDLFTTLGQPSGVVRSRTGAGRAVDPSDSALPQTARDNRYGLTPEFEVAAVAELGESLLEERRKLGMTDLLLAPAGAIATGQSALVTTSGLPRREIILRAPVALHINLRSPFDPESPAQEIDLDDDCMAAARSRPRPGGIRYPNSLMGVVAHLRQAMLDADHAHAIESQEPDRRPDRVAFDPALRALHAARTRALPVWWEANTRDEIHRALDLSEEFGTTAVIVGGRDAAKVVDRLKEKDVPVVLRIDYPDEPKVPTEAEYKKRELADRDVPRKVLVERAERWKERVGTAKALAKAGVRFAFGSEGIAKVEQFPAQVRKVIAAGLAPEAALDALTRRAAELAGLGKSLGTIEPGKLGHLVVMTGAFSDESSRVRYVLVDGLKFDLDRPGASKKADHESRPKDKDKDKEKEPAKDEPKTEETKPAEPPKAEEPRPKAEDARPKAASATPTATATQAPVAATPTPAPAPSGSPPTAPAPATPPAARTIEDQPPQSTTLDVATEFDSTRKPRIKTGGNVLIKDATILTVGKAGTIAKGSILVKDGKIAALGAEVEAPRDVTVIDANGLVAMPGIIDTHSHIAIQGGVNEMSHSIVAEVRVKDVVTGDDPSIYRALAGGVTTARLLHGSANTIGGQDAVIKLRQGAPGRDLILKDAPQGIKFALGENVTRVSGRFPNTRMGVEATLERAFEDGQAYRAAWKAYEAARAEKKDLIPPRRDLRLEALAGVLDGSIKIHCHCYRSDEILMLLRLAERHGVRVQSLQHVLEGYKVAPEIAAHGASASTFSDWWAYKVEAYDAIPFNAALLTQAGASVCIKSDSEELIRHLYLEAAKMVKYGGASEAQALAMITLNPARELGLSDRLGSLDVGKDADIALFNAHPFDAFARCALVLIDGEVRFQRPEKEDKLVPRPGQHASMPASSVEARAKGLEVADNPKGVYALVGATLHPVDAPEIPDGTLIVADGRIKALGDAQTAVPTGAHTVDVKGFDIWPGLVDAGSRLGLYEIGSLGETHDDADSAQFEPELRTSAALRPDSEQIPVTRANGVLTAYVQPNGGLISGQGCVIDLGGWVPRELVLADEVALHVNIPRYIPRDPDSSRSRGGGDGPDPRQRRREQLESIREEFRRALAYDKVQAEALARRAAPPVPDPRLAAIVPFARGKKPVVFRADHRNEILDALKLAEELKLKAVITGGADAWKVADALKAADVPVLVAGTLQLPNEETDPYDAPYSNPARLFEAGVTFAIRSNGQGPEQATAGRNLPYEAATAVAFGLPEAEALKAVTLNPAKILGVADQVGSLGVGKRANLVITAGHILQPTTEVKALFLDGKPLPPESRHTQLYARYQRRLAEVQAGRAPLGLDPKPAPSLAPSPRPMPPPSGTPATTQPRPAAAPTPARLNGR